MGRETGTAVDWLARLRLEVPIAVRERGEDYFHQGRVEVGAVGSGQARATVLGTSTYEVVLESRAPRLRFSCDCAHVEREGSPCKHVWALLLELDHEGQLTSLDSAAPRTFELASPDEMPGAEDVGGDAFEASASSDDDFDEPWDQDDDEDQAPGGSLYSESTRRLPRPVPGAQAGSKTDSRPAWRQLIALVEVPSREAWLGDRSEVWRRRQLFYTVSAPQTLRGDGLAVTVSLRERKKDGSWGKIKQQRLTTRELPLLGEAVDREVLAMISGATGGHYGWYPTFDREIPANALLSGPLVNVALPRMAESGRLLLLPRDGRAEPRPVTPDFEQPFDLVLRLVPEGEAAYRLVGELRRGEESLPLSAVELAVSEGWFFGPETLCRFSDARAFVWFAALRQVDMALMPAAEARPWLASVLNQRFVPKLELPSELDIVVVPGVPSPRLSVRSPVGAGARHLAAELSFDYGTAVVAFGQEGGELFEPNSLRMVLRDHDAEAAARARLNELGVKPAPSSARAPFELRVAERDLPRVARSLLAEGWWVEAEGRPLRRTGPFQVEVRSGVDWFDLSAAASFEGEKVSLPAILAALERGERWLRLGDGGLGLLPEEWLEQRGLLTQLGQPVGENLRFRRVQAGLLDALVGDLPELVVDETFAHARRELEAFAGIEPADPPPSFAGTLREYQRFGLGWLKFLHRFGFGGCLADDMGLGKTVQVLALLAGDREENESGGPSLVVAPRSVVFNWAEEAARFWPSARLLVHSGTSRTREGENLAAFDLVVTSYGLLREDVAMLANIEWRTVVLDEAQAIKNASSQTAQVARRLKASRRLALSGTPIENHLGELWSLFEFLNPGLLGHSAAFQRASAKPDATDRVLLARALRPFILRRTKAQVLPELPAKTEQTLHCELEPAERQRYDELRHFYQATLKKRVDAMGWAKAKIHVLEALLRLRQAACHPGLLDPKLVSQPSAKLEALLPLLSEALEGGHKVLVFSQFTSLLAIVRSRLEEQRTPYLYLDGKTRDRQAQVSRFQNDREARLFLISLKAGGLGLNLTAADYVFLLDPWWNPAVEAQAIDRAHRIGQERHVFAYRLVARDTVEEKILELQAAKRELADSILSEDANLIRQLTREDLEMLLG